MVDASIHIYDSVTTLAPSVQGGVLIAASHGGRYAAYLAALAGVKGVVLNDAGVGREDAGIAGLALLTDCRIAGATVSHRSARIGDGRDMAARGRISNVNPIAKSLGVVPDMTACEAAKRMAASPLSPFAPSPMPKESRSVLQLGHGKRPVVLIDSVSLVTEADKDAIVITGSHGGLQGGKPATAVKYPVFAALYNDAGVGIDDAGISRLPALDARGIIGATMSADSARIGDARSGFEDGVLSFINDCAKQRGGRVGMTVREFTRLLSELPE